MKNRVDIIRLMSDPSFPFSPSGFPFYYGWLALVVAIIGMLASVPGQTIGFSVFSEPLMAVSEMSRLRICFAYFLGTMGSSLFLKRAGLFYDRQGGRIQMVLAGLSMGILLFLLSQLAHIFGFLLHLPGQVGSLAVFIVMSLGFMGIRYAGQGVLMLTSRNLIGKWFVRRRGFVASVAGLAMAVGFSLTPPLFQAMISSLGWSGCYQCLSLGMITVTLFSWLFYRDNPEECGLQVDGKEQGSGASEESGIGGASLSLASAQRSLAFWSLLAALCLYGLVITALSFHIKDIGRAAGISQEKAINLFIPLALISGGCGLVSGWLSDKIQLRYIICLMMGGCVAGFSGMSFLRTGSGYYAAIAGLGVAGGCFSVLSGAAIPHFFGRGYLGEINGYQMACLVFSTATGPLLFALCRHFTSGYSLAFLLSAVLAAANFVLAAKIRHPGLY